MKKGKSFKTGDKVFAKVKGYPPWPAKVTAVNGKKFTVEFYGTGEIGSIKSEDLFYYLKHKSNLAKPSKRKDYNDALGQIEAAVNKAGTDGNEYPDDSLTDVSIASVSSDKEKRGPKRKRLSSDHSDTPQPAKKGGRTKSSEKSPPKSDKKEEKTNEKQEDETNDKKEDITNEKKEDETNDKRVEESSDIKLEQTSDQKENEEPKEKDSLPGYMGSGVVTGNEEVPPKFVETADTEPEPESEFDAVKVETKKPKQYSKKIMLVSEKDLESYIAYAKHVKENDTMYKLKPEEPREDYPNHVFAVKLPSGTFIALKVHLKWPLDFSNEYDRALYDADAAERLLSMKRDLEAEKVKPNKDNSSFLKDFKMVEKDIEVALQTDMLKRKKAKTERLKAEARLVELDSNIKACLGLDKADPKKALEYLETMINIDMDEFMLIKHPHVVEMIRRIRKYVGNTEEWNLKGKSLETFQNDANKLRAKADELWEKIRGLVKIPTESPNFWDGFNELVNRFRVLTKHMTEDQILFVNSEPFSRQFFMEQYEEKKPEENTEEKKDEKEIQQAALEPIDITKDEEEEPKRVEDGGPSV